MNIPENHIQNLLDLRQIYLSEQKKHEDIIKDIRLKVMHIEALLTIDNQIPTQKIEHSVAYINPTVTTISEEEEEEEEEEENDNDRLEKDKVNDETSQLEALPRFNGMTQLQALRLIFEENSGEALHISAIAEEYYGDINSVGLRLKAKGRMSTVLKVGVEKKLWQRLLKEPGFYTLDRKLL